MKTINIPAIMTIDFSSDSSITELQEFADESSVFAYGKLRIAYPGQNRNNTSITKEVFDKCKGSIFNCPIVANYDIQEDEIGGHDIGLIKNKDGQVRMYNVTEPLGVVPESSNIYWETVEDQNGQKEYLTAEVLIWKRQPCYTYVKEHGVTAHSMEISVNDGETIDGVYVINDFKFCALCLLGEGVEPCFEASALQTFDVHSFKSEYQKMLNDLSDMTATILNTHSTEEEDITMELSKEQLALIEQYGLDKTQIAFDYEAMSIEDFEDKLKELGKTSKEEFMLNLKDFMNEVEEIVMDEEVNVDQWGWESPRYWLIDIQDDEAIVVDEKENWHLFGIPLSLDGDAVETDFSKKKRKKCKYENFEEGEQLDFSLQKMQTERLRLSEAFAQTKDKYENQLSESAKEFDSLKADYEQLMEKYEKVVEAEEARQKDEHTSQIAAVFEKFAEKLHDCPEFDSLKENSEEYSAEDLEKECFVLVGKLNFETTKTKKTEKAAKIIFNNHAKEEEKPYGGLYEKYGR